MARNVLGGELEPCSFEPLTGFYRDGCCESGGDDDGVHSVCVIVTDEFLEFSRARGNDLSTPMPAYGFPGLVAGNQWCLCASRWQEAYEAGKAPQVVLAATQCAHARVVFARRAARSRRALTPRPAWVPARARFSRAPEKGTIAGARDTGPSQVRQPSMPVVRRILDPEPVPSLDVYVRDGGGRGLKAAHALGPDATIDEVTAAGCTRARRRGVPDRREVADRRRQRVESRAIDRRRERGRG